MQESHTISTTDVCPYAEAVVTQTSTSSAPEYSAMTEIAASSPTEDHDKLLFYPVTWENFVQMLSRSGVVISTHDAGQSFRIGGDLFGLHCRQTYGGVLVGSDKAFRKLDIPGFLDVHP